MAANQRPEQVGPLLYSLQHLLTEKIFPTGQSPLQKVFMKMLMLQLLTNQNSPAAKKAERVAWVGLHF